MRVARERVLAHQYRARRKWRAEAHEQVDVDTAAAGHADGQLLRAGVGVDVVVRYVVQWRQDDLCGRAGCQRGLRQGAGRAEQDDCAKSQKSTTQQPPHHGCSGAVFAFTFPAAGLRFCSQTMPREPSAMRTTVVWLTVGDAATVA